MTVTTQPGYTYGTDQVARSPLTVGDLELLKQAVFFGPDDERYLLIASDVLADQIDDVLDVWYGFVAVHPHLVYYFTDGTGHPNSEYLATVRQRFGQQILDTRNRPYDEHWLNYAYAIGLRHHRSKKNVTDGIRAVPYIHFRYMVAFIYPITATMRPFLAKKGYSPEEVERMHHASFKSVVMQAAL